MSAPAPTEPVVGWQAAELERELPGLRLLVSEVDIGRPGPLTGDSPPDIEARLRELSNRVRGARAIGIRREPVPAAYRVFFRHIGMDPDVDRTPIEAAVLERMVRGGFLTGGLLDDVLLIALMDTGVPVWALDAEQLDGPLGIRAAGEGERLGRSPDPPLLPEGRLVIADASAAVAVLFGDLAPGQRPQAASRRLALYAVQVPGVPALYAEEALWSAASALQAR
jgi:DNA/RNA-binding domain of Phe-tRNA-synthetase-like protein